MVLLQDGVIVTKELLPLVRLVLTNLRLIFLTTSAETNRAVGWELKLQQIGNLHCK